jgi:hypothetical protein
VIRVRVSQGRDRVDRSDCQETNHKGGSLLLVSTRLSAGRGSGKPRPKESDRSGLSRCDRVVGLVEVERIDQTIDGK